jgi:hypothetical protein
VGACGLVLQNLLDVFGKSALRGLSRALKCGDGLVAVGRHDRGHQGGGLRGVITLHDVGVAHRLLGVFGFGYSS